MKKKKIAISAVIILILFLIFTLIYSFYIKNKYVTRDFSNLDLSGVDSIMIVAHPDDETMWGSSHLIDGNFLVVCLTAGGNEKRAKELLSAVKKTNDKCVMLGYPDKTFFRRNNWDSCEKDISDDIEKLLALKDWKMIVTHNPDGEYGHIQHIMTNQIVTDVFRNNYIENDNLYYFGAYYKKSDMQNAQASLEKISENNLAVKLDIIQNVYKSQDFLMEKFGHTTDYENWTKFIEQK